MARWIERKVRPRLWKFTYVRVSRYKPRGKYIKAQQYAIKTGKDTYSLVFKGYQYNRRRR